MSKRILAMVVSAAAILALSPLLTVIALLIKREDGGPVLYSGVRAGLNGHPFRMHKFRTMTVNADKIGGPNTPDDDPRITQIGCKLRNYKLDELPQLWNVLVGEMSLVGPRPQVLEEVALYSEEERHLLTVRPGITDWASIRFRNEGEILRGAADPYEAYRNHIRPEKIQLGLAYVNHASVATDIRILASTAKSILSDFSRRSPKTAPPNKDIAN